MAQPLQFYDSPEVVSLPTERHRVIARQWLGFIGRALGLYCVDAQHICTERCFGGATQDVQTCATNLKNVSHFRKPQSRTTVLDSLHSAGVSNHIDYRRTHIIDTRLNMYGCPISGSIHHCADTPAGRRKTCQLRFETLDAGFKCCYSGLTIYESALVYNKFTDTGMEVEFMRRAQSGSRGQKDAADAVGRRRVVSGNERRLQNYDRPLPFYEKKLWARQSQLSVQGQQLSAPSSTTHRLPHRYTISHTAYLNVKRAVRLLLFDPAVHENVGNAVPVCAPVFCNIAGAQEKTEQLLEQYCERVCLIFVVSERVWNTCSDVRDSHVNRAEQDRRRRNVHRRAKHSGPRKSSAPVRTAFPSAKFAAYVILKLLASGVALAPVRGAVARAWILHRDPVLSRCLPDPQKLDWYTMTPEERLRYRNYRKTPNKRTISPAFGYSTKHEQLFTKILKQQAHPDLLRLKRILSTYTLPLYCSPPL